MYYLKAITNSFHDYRFNEIIKVVSEECKMCLRGRDSLFRL